MDEEEKKTPDVISRYDDGRQTFEVIIIIPALKVDWP